MIVKGNPGVRTLETMSVTSLQRSLNQKMTVVVRPAFRAHDSQALLLNVVCCIYLLITSLLHFLKGALCSYRAGSVRNKDLSATGNNG